MTGVQPNHPAHSALPTMRRTEECIIIPQRHVSTGASTTNGRAANSSRRPNMNRVCYTIHLNQKDGFTSSTIALHNPRAHQRPKKVDCHCQICACYTLTRRPVPVSLLIQDPKRVPRQYKDTAQQLRAKKPGVCTPFRFASRKIQAYDEITIRS